MHSPAGDGELDEEELQREMDSLQAQRRVRFVSQELYASSCACAM